MGWSQVGHPETERSRKQTGDKMIKADLKIYKQQGKTWSNPADSLRDTFSKKEIDFLCDYNHNSPLYKIEINRNTKLYSWGSETSRIVRNTEWIEFYNIEDFLVEFYKLLNGNALNLSDKDYKFLYKIIDKIATIRYRNILANKPKYQSLLANNWIG